MVIVDTHCHVSPYWYEPVETLLHQMNSNGVDKALLIQLGQVRIYDNSYLIECIRRFPGRFSAVGVVDTNSPDASERLEEWVNQGLEGLRLRATQQSPGSDPIAIWRKAADLGIAISVQGTVEEFGAPEFEKVIKELPSLNIIIEHLGSAREDTTPPHNAYRKVLALAQYPNTFMKVPGLGEISERFMPFRPPFPFETVPPLIEMAIDAFGAHRLMWGSDFPPVAGLREGYRNALRLPMEHVHFKSEEDKEWTFGKTATTLFRFGE